MEANAMELDICDDRRLTDVQGLRPDGTIVAGDDANFSTMRENDRPLPSFEEYDDSVSGVSKVTGLADATDELPGGDRTEITRARDSVPEWSDLTQQLTREEIEKAMADDSCL